MIQAVLFDMDGLMFDTERLSVTAWRKVAAEQRLPVTDEMFIRMTGVNKAAGDKIIHEIYGDDFDVDAFESKVSTVMMQQIARSGMPIKPGLRDLLSYLQQAGVRMAVATSTARRRMEEYLHRACIREFFTCFATGDEVQNSKPAPDVFLLAAQRLGVSAQNTVVLEDSANGVLAAAAAGMRCVCVPDMVTPPPEVLQRAAVVLPDLKEVKTWIAANKN